MPGLVCNFCDNFNPMGATVCEECYAPLGDKTFRPAIFANPSPQKNEAKSSQVESVKTSQQVEVSNNIPVKTTEAKNRAKPDRNTLFENALETGGILGLCIAAGAYLTPTILVGEAILTVVIFIIATASKWSGASCAGIIVIAVVLGGMAVSASPIFVLIGVVLTGIGTIAGSIIGAITGLVNIVVVQFLKKLPDSFQKPCIVFFSSIVTAISITVVSIPLIPLLSIFIVVNFFIALVCGGWLGIIILERPESEVNTPINWSMLLAPWKVYGTVAGRSINTLNEQERIAKRKLEKSRKG